MSRERMRHRIPCLDCFIAASPAHEAASGGARIQEGAVRRHTLPGDGARLGSVADRGV